MYNAETLRDIHARAHESLRRLIAFCGELTADELGRPLSGALATEEERRVFLELTAAARPFRES